MNTWIWGPPKWKFLHSLSYSPAATAHAEDVAAFVQSVQHVLPCVYCRDSYATFLPRLQQQFGALEEVVAAGNLSRWMYALHDLVNAKLDQQLAEDMFEKEGVKVSPSKITTLCRKRQITYECLTKRFIIRPVQFCDEDIWEFLEIFALNADATKADMPADRLSGHYTFFRLFPLMLTIAGASSAVVHAVQTAASSFPATMARTSARDAVFRWVLAQKKTATEHPPRPVAPAQLPLQYVNQEEAVFNHARSNPKSCTHGSCQ